MIPTSIDGTDITGASIDGTDVTEITVDGDTVFEAVTIPNSVVTQYRFEDNTNTSVAVDSVGTNDANINGPTYTSDAAKGSFAVEDPGIDNSGNDITSQNNVDLVASGPNDALSIAGFVKANNVNSDFRVPFLWGADGNNQLALFQQTTWRARITVNNTVTEVDSGVSISDTAYQHVVVVCDQSEIAIIVDGTLEGTTSHNLDVTQIGSGVARMFNSLRSVNLVFDGSIDNVSFMNDRITTTEAQPLINQ